VFVNILGEWSDYIIYQWNFKIAIKSWPLVLLGGGELCFFQKSLHLIYTY